MRESGVIQVMFKRLCGVIYFILHLSKPSIHMWVEMGAKSLNYPVSFLPLMSPLEIKLNRRVCAEEVPCPFGQMV